MGSLTVGIKSDNRVILKDANYRVCETLLEQTLRYQKLSQHANRTTVLPPAARVVSPGVTTVAAGLGIAAVAAIADITQEHVDSDTRKIEDYEAAIAKANYIILYHIQRSHVMSLQAFKNLSQKWQKLQADYARFNVGDKDQSSLFRFQAGEC